MQKGKGGGGTAEGGGVQAGNEREGAAVREGGASVRFSILPTAMQSCFNQVSPEPCNVFMGSTFSELFYFYFQRAKKRKRKQGGEGDSS